MFLYLEHHSAGPWAITQNSHAWMAWQIASHWGNRIFSRAAPRPETESAVLLHDSGWEEYDHAPDLDDKGTMRTFDRMVPQTHLRLWRKSVARTEDRSRYAAGLVAAHFSQLARRKIKDLMAAGDLVEAGKVHAFEAEMEGLRDGWNEKLAVDPRYEAVLSGSGIETNSRILAACDALSVFLCASMSGNFSVKASTRAGEAASIKVEAHGPRTFSLSPWPLEGKRLKVHCEARHLRRRTFDSRDDCRKALESAPVQRLGFQLLSPSEVGR